MEYTSQHLEAGYAKLHKWLTFEARGFAKDVLEVSATVREAVARLKSRPEQLSCVLVPLFLRTRLAGPRADSPSHARSEVLSILGTTRSTSILNLFLDALTRGGPNGLPRPIELHAHDPIRYIGDMLAWLHQAMAGEREFLESLFGTRGDDESQRRRVGEVHALSRHKRVRTGVDGIVGGVVSDRDRVKKLLDRDLEGCGRPLKVRRRSPRVLAVLVESAKLIQSHLDARRSGSSRRSSRRSRPSWRTRSRRSSTSTR